MKRRTSLITVALFLVILIAAAGYAAWKVSRPVYTAQLDEISWPSSAPFTIMKTAGNAEGVNPGTYVYLADGSARYYFSGEQHEFLSPSEILMNGTLVEAGPEIEDRTGLYLIGRSGATAISLPKGTPALEKFSLSPKRNFLAYTEDVTPICIASFSESERALGPCDDVASRLSGNYDLEESYFLDGNWALDEDTYVIKVREKENYTILSAATPDQAPLQVQNEIARFAYDPAKKVLSKLPLDKNVPLKSLRQFLEPPDEALEDAFGARADYAFIYDRKGGSIGIEEKTTGRRARLAAAPYFGDMAGFDMYWYGYNFPFSGE